MNTARRWFMTAAGRSARAFPLGLVDLEVGVGDEEMPDDRLERLGVRRHVVRVDRGDDHTGVGDLGRVAAVLADEADAPGADLLGELESGDEIGRDVLLEVAAADGENHYAIPGGEARASQPLDKH